MNKINYDELIPFKPIKSIFYTRRRALNLTQAEVAKAVGMSLKQYQRYERGEVEIAGIPFQLGVSLCELLHIDIFDVVCHLKDLQEDAADFDDETFLPGHLEKA